jgi:hypothetical protein
VAGIAAGDYTVGAVPGRGPLSGVAPKAYLGNYKALSTPTSEFGLIENSVEVIAAIEAAVRDGMDVINMSLGEIEVGPSRAILDQAVDGAAEAGVVPAIAAGNDFDEFGRGSVSTPGSANLGISAAAVTKSDVMAPFSSSGPTPLSLRLKPDVSAPGVSILSSVPPREGTWTQFSGTSMATPHVAGGAALLIQRHPDWTVAQITSALVQTAGPAYMDTSHTVEAPTTREGGGLINLPRANNPLLFASPTGLSFGLLRVGKSAVRPVELTDAGGGAGSWKVVVQTQERASGVTVTAPATVTVPGAFEVTAAAGPAAAELDVTGFVVLTRGSDSRRIPFWFRVERPRLGPPAAKLSRPGVYTANSRGAPARATSYRYPDDPTPVGVAKDLMGPEKVFSVRVTKRIANFGFVILSQGPSSRVTPRLVADDDENRLLGYRALPVDLNPYLSTYGRLDPIVAAVRPAPGIYDVVFDSTARSHAGRFTFRFWRNDTTPPRAHLLTRRIKAGKDLLVSAIDTGSGVDPRTVSATIDGREAAAFYKAKPRVVELPLVTAISPGVHHLKLQVSDYEEEKNSESVPGVLPNTRFYSASFIVTR